MSGTNHALKEYRKKEISPLHNDEKKRNVGGGVKSNVKPEQ
jgi:hypothetical protein